MGTLQARPAQHRVRYGLLAVAAVLLTACGGATATSSAKAAAAAPQPATGSGAGTYAAATAGNGAQVGQAVVPALLDRSVIRTATIEVRVTDVLDAAGRAQALAASAGGYVAAEQTQADPDHPDLSRAVVTLRVPGTALPQLLTDVAHLGALLAQDQSSTDVTGQVIDVAARLASQQASVDRIRALLSQATTIGQVVQVEGELASREGALESLQAQAKALADQTALATVTATLVGRQAAAPVQPAPSKGFGHGLSQGWDAFSAAATWLLTAVGAVLPFGIVGVPLGWLVWTARQRRTQAARPPVEAEAA